MKPGPSHLLASAVTLLVGALAVATGGGVLLGWALDVAALKSVLPGWVSVKPNTAVAFVLTGLALLLFRRPSAFGLPPLAVLSRLASLLAGLLGLLSLAEYAFDWNPGFDQWLFAEPAEAVGTSHPGRMAPDTAICFALLAVGLEFARRARQTGSSSTAPILVGALIVATGLVEILSYFSPVLRTHGWGGLTMMALPTAVLFTALGAALVGIAVACEKSAPGDSAQPFARSEHATSRRFFLIFAVLAVGIVTAGVFYYRNIEREFRLDAERQLTAIAQLKVDELTQWRTERLGDGSMPQHNPAFIQLVRRCLATPAEAEAQRQLRAWLREYQTHFNYERLSLVDPQGAERLATSATLGPTSGHIIANLTAVLQSGRVTLLDFHRDAPDRPIHLVVLVPLLDEADGHRPLGAIALRIDPNEYLFPLIIRWPVPSATAETLLIRREEQEVVYLNELRFLKNTALTWRISLAQTDLPAVRAALGQEGIVEGRDYRDVPVLAAVRAIPDSPWFLVARRDKAEIFAPLRSQLGQIVIVMGGLLLGAGAGLGAVWRQQRLQSYQARLQAAEALQLEKQNLDAILESSPTPMFVLDETTKIVRVNAAALVLTGGPASTALEHRPGDALGCVHSSRDPRGCGYAPACPLCPARNGIESLLTQGGAIRGAELMLTLVRAGAPQQVWVSIGAEPVHLNGRRHLCVAMEDITERKQAAAAIATEKQNLEALFASSPVAMFILDETTKIVRVNAAAVALSGASSAEVLEHRPGNALGCRHSMEDPRGCGYSTACRVCATRNGLESVLAKGGELKGVELPFELVRHGEIQKVWMAVGAQPILMSGRRHLIVAMDDITARKQAREKILQLNAELDQRVADRTVALAAANKELEAFSYSVSHDLRAPLRSIDGFSRVVLEDYAPRLDADGRDSLNRIRAAAQRMGHLIDAMLDLSRVSRTELHRNPVDLSALAREVGAELRQQEPARAVELTVAEGLAAECDLRLMRIVLENLLGNAWKFTGQCAAPRIEVGLATTPALSPLNPQLSTPAFFIRDNGAGFDEAYAGKLFGAFQRLHTVGQFAGTGIGLATVQRIMHRHGGRVWAKAKVGEGATFYFTLEKSERAETP